MWGWREGGVRSCAWAGAGGRQPVTPLYWPHPHPPPRCYPRTHPQGPSLREDDSALVAALVGALGEVIAGSYTAEAGGRRPSPEAKSLIAATAFDDMFKDKFAQESGASQ